MFVALPVGLMLGFSDYATLQEGDVILSTLHIASIASSILYETGERVARETQAAHKTTRYICNTVSAN